MPRFSYTAYDDKGARLEGEVESDSREEAVALLFRQGRYPLDVTDAAAAPEARWWERDLFGARLLSQGQITHLTRELATLVKAELPLDQCLRIVSLQPLMQARARQAVSGMLRRVLEGASLSEAARLEGSFPEYYWRIIQAGEQGGTLGQSLDDLARFLERSAEFRQRVSSALLYPMLLLITAGIALLVVLTVLIPAIVPLFKDAGVEPPLFIRTLIGAENLVTDNWPFALPIGGLLIVAAVVLFRTEAAKEARDRALLRLPVLSTMIQNGQTTVMARTLATLIKSGVPMLQALQVTGSVLRNRAMAAGIEECMREVKEGSSLSAPLGRSGLFPELSVRLIGVGEQTGQLDTMLSRVADIYDSALQQQLTRVTSLLTPVLTIVIGAMVGGLLLSVMGAIVSLNDLALQ
jgi:general secretion pathway protein F